MCERALEKFLFSSILCSFMVLFSSNDMLKWNMRASASGIVIFLEFDSISLYFTQISLNSLNFWIISLYFTQISLNSLNFWIISFSFLKFPWNSLNFWNSLKNSLRRSKFLRFRPKKEEISLKVEALLTGLSHRLMRRGRGTVPSRGRNERTLLGAELRGAYPPKAALQNTRGGGGDVLTGWASQVMQTMATMQFSSVQFIYFIFNTNIVNRIYQAGNQYKQYNFKHKDNNWITYWKSKSNRKSMIFFN